MEKYKIIDKSLSRVPINNIRFIIVQHLMSDTLKFIDALRRHKIEIAYILSKRYSHDAAVYAKICLYGISHSFVEDVTELELSLILSTEDEYCSMHQKKFIVLDLGGVFSNILFSKKYQNIIGVVEDTKFGHRKYEYNKYSFPVMSIANSEIKKIEARFVGKAIIDATEMLSKNIGQTMAGKKILLIGYGMIGREVIKNLLFLGCKVFVHDISNLALLNAYFDGCTIYGENTNDKFDYIIGDTGYTTITFDLIKKSINNQIILSSGSSNQIEFDLNNLYTELKFNDISANISLAKYNNNHVYLLCNGKPINFILNSVPDEIIELIFAEMLECIYEILNKTVAIGAIQNTINLDNIAKYYLEEKL